MEFSRTALDTSTTLLGLRLNNVTRYLGIPYAEPPVGDRRFRPPAPLSLSGLVNATAHGPWCPQLAPGATGDVLGDEDNCLTLNVYVPDNLPPKAPVLVWIHGGGLMTGAAPLYNLSALAAAGGAVGVTVQYRLNALGFLAAPGLASVGAGGNLGVADQVAALKWVNTHAAAFGADATRVTVLGQSAGGTSVLLLAAAPAARGLFARAVAQSPWWAGRLIAGIDTATAARKVWSGCVGDANATAAGGDAPAPLCARRAATSALVPAGGADRRRPRRVRRRRCRHHRRRRARRVDADADGIDVRQRGRRGRERALPRAGRRRAPRRLDRRRVPLLGDGVRLERGGGGGARVEHARAHRYVFGPRPRPRRRRSGDAERDVGPSRRRAPPIMCSARRPRRTPPTSRCRYPTLTSTPTPRPPPK